MHIRAYSINYPFFAFTICTVVLCILYSLSVTVGRLKGPNYYTLNPRNVAELVARVGCLIGVRVGALVGL